LTIWFLAFLAVAWIVVYLPAARRARHSSPWPAAQRFKRRMRLISPHTSAGRWIVIPGANKRVAKQAVRRGQQRRKAIFVTLLSIVFFTAAWSLANGGQGLELNLVADAATAFYSALLLDAKRRRDERAVKVHSLKRPIESESEYFEVIEASGGHNR
jgi:hypothetical protein